MPIGRKQAFEIALSCARGSYQENVLRGDLWSSASLRGKAQEWSMNYAKSRANLHARCRDALPDAFTLATAEHGRTCAIYGTDEVKCYRLCDASVDIVEFETIERIRTYGYHRANALHIHTQALRSELMQLASTLADRGIAHAGRHKVLIDIYILQLKALFVRHYYDSRPRRRELAPIQRPHVHWFAGLDLVEEISNVPCAPIAIVTVVQAAPQRLSALQRRKAIQRYATDSDFRDALDVAHEIGAAVKVVAQQIQKGK